MLRPAAAARALKEKFSRGAESQQFLVEAMVGMQTHQGRRGRAGDRRRNGRSGSPPMSARPSATGMLGGRAARTPSNMSASCPPPLMLLFGAKAVIDGELTVGELVAFNMIAGQVAQPMLRLSQLWQDFQQVQVSVERLGDILNAPSETGRRRCAPRSAAAARQDRVPQCQLPLSPRRAGGAEEHSRCASSPAR